MRIGLLLAGLALWATLALQDGRPRVGAGIGWLQTGIFALASGDGGVPDGGQRVLRQGEAGQHVPR